MRKSLKFNKVKTSTKSHRHLITLKMKTGLATNVLSRFAICLSLKELGIPNPDEFNQEGSEFEPTILFGEHELVYLALFIQRLKNDKLDPEIYLDKMLFAHLNRGVIALSPRISNLSDFYELIKEERDV